MKPFGATAMGVGGLFLCWTLATAIAQQPTIERKVLQTQDLPIPGYQAVMATVELPAGAREGRHTHPEQRLSRSWKGSSRLTKKASQRPPTRPETQSTLRLAKSTKVSTTERPL